jgi:hypothetical protein
LVCRVEALFEPARQFLHFIAAIHYDNTVIASRFSTAISCVMNITAVPVFPLRRSAGSLPGVVSAVVGSSALTDVAHLRAIAITTLTHAAGLVGYCASNGVLARDTHLP